MPNEQNEALKPIPWDAKRMDWLFRFARKNDGPWSDDYLEPSETAGMIPEEGDGQRIIDAVFKPLPGATSKLVEALTKALQFTCMSLAFIGRDLGTERLASTLEGLCKQAAELDPILRAALASTAEPGGSFTPESYDPLSGKWPRPFAPDQPAAPQPQGVSEAYEDGSDKSLIRMLRELTSSTQQQPTDS